MVLRRAGNVYRKRPPTPILDTLQLRGERASGRFWCCAWALRGGCGRLTLWTCLKRNDRSCLNLRRIREFISTLDGTPPSGECLPEETPNSNSGHPTATWGTGLWAVLVLCLGTAWGMRTVDPLDLPKAERQILSESAEDQRVFFNARWYSAERGMFTGRDPQLQFWTPYSYVGNGPLLGTDPTGGLGIGVTRKRYDLNSVPEGVSYSFNVNTWARNVEENHPLAGIVADALDAADMLFGSRNGPSLPGDPISRQAFSGKVQGIFGSVSDAYSVDLTIGDAGNSSSGFSSAGSFKLGLLGKFSDNFADGNLSGKTFSTGFSVAPDPMLEGGIGIETIQATGK